MFNYAELKNSVRKLQTNEQNIGKEILLQKYGRPYEKLRREIANQASEMMRTIALEAVDCLTPRKSIEVARSEQLEEKMWSDIKRIADEEQKAGTYIKVAETIFNEYDLDKAMEIAFRRLYTRIRYEALPPVWLYFCREDPGRGYVNELTKMRWIPPAEGGMNGYWEKDDYARTEVRFDLPPTWAEIANEYEETKVREWEV